MAFLYFDLCIFVFSGRPRPKLHWTESSGLSIITHIILGNWIVYRFEEIREIYFCCYCAIVSARVLSNGGVLAGNKLMYESTGGARCYVRPKKARTIYGMPYTVSIYTF